MQVFQVILTGVCSASVVGMHWKIQPFCCVWFITLAMSVELYNLYGIYKVHNFIGTLHEPGIRTARPLAGSTFEWAAQLSKQCLVYLDSTQHLFTLFQNTQR